MRKSTLPSCLLALAFVSIALPFESHAAANRPNVVLIITDDKCENTVLDVKNRRQ